MAVFSFHLGSSSVRIVVRFRRLAWSPGWPWRARLCFRHASLTWTLIGSRTSSLSSGGILWGTLPLQLHTYQTPLASEEAFKASLVKHLTGSEESRYTAAIRRLCFEAYSMTVNEMNCKITRPDDSDRPRKLPKSAPTTPSPGVSCQQEPAGRVPTRSEWRKASEPTAHVEPPFKRNKPDASPPAWTHPPDPLPSGVAAGLAATHPQVQTTSDADLTTAPGV